MRVLIIILILSSCSGNQSNSSNDIIGKTLNLWADSFQKQKNLPLTKTIYKGTSSSQTIDSNVNWKVEFEPLKKYSLRDVEKSNDLVFDTVFDERTNRYLLRGMRMGKGEGLQNLFMVLDSQRNMIQFRIVNFDKSWLGKTKTELFWDKEGEYSFRTQKQSRFSKDEEHFILGDWR